MLLGAACTPPALIIPIADAPTASQPAASTQTLIPTKQPAPTITPTPMPVICSPLAVQPLENLDQIVTQPFIMPRVLLDDTYSDDGHHGLDLGYYTRDGKPFNGTPVLAAIAGKISSVIIDRPPYGNMIMIETAFDGIPASLIARQNIPPGNSLYTLYAHMQNVKGFTLGQGITCGQQLGETGSTGLTGGHHLHFETRWGPSGSTFPKMAFYRADQTPEEAENYKRWRNSRQFRLFDPFELLNP